VVVSIKRRNRLPEVGKVVAPKCRASAVLAPLPGIVALIAPTTPERRLGPSILSGDWHLVASLTDNCDGKLRRCTIPNFA
jgi:hypothetical protein